MERRKVMERCLLMGTVMLFGVAGFAPGAILGKTAAPGWMASSASSWTWKEQGNPSVAVRSMSGDRTQVDFRTNDYSWDEVMISGRPYWKILLGGEASMMQKGAPDLPNICRSLIIPDNAKMAVSVIDAEYRELDNVLVAPSKGVLPRTVDPEEVPYEFGDAYRNDAWYPDRIVQLDEPYILRDYRGQVVRVCPFQYNPVRKKLRIYTDIRVEVAPVGEGEVNVFQRRRPLEVMDPEFRRIYERHFLNFGPDVMGYTAVEEGGNMLVITDDNLWSIMEPFVGWKNMKGVPTEMVRISDIGNNANSIKNYITDYFNANGLTYVLLVGDIGQITTFHFTYGFEQGASDPTYSYIVGNDHYPDLFVGRFSAQNMTQAVTMVRRSVNYESAPQAGAAWYHQGTGVASNEGPGDDGEYDWEHIRNIRSDLMGYNYTLVDELYDGSHGGEDASGNPTTASLASALNAGRSVINYCGHGWEQGWSTTGFDNYDVNGLYNNGMLPFIWSVACSNGAFDDMSTCFAEAWLRATNSGEASGAVAAFMSSITQSWNPPMDAQDEMVDILVETYQDNIKRTFGGISFNGCMHMNDRYGNSGYQETDTWHVFGDPSLEVRTDTPATMTVQHDSTITVGSNGFEVTVPGVEGALCSISRDSVFLGSGYTNGNGRALIHLDQPLSAGNDVDLVVTAYNMIPYQATIGVTTGPAVVYVDDSYPQFVVLNGNWTYGEHPNATNGNGRYTRAGVGDKSVGWGVTSAVTPGTYDVYAWKFEHNYSSLMATDAHYKVYYKAGESDWILIDQSTPGNEWVYLGTFDFDNTSTQGVMLTDQANGFVVADAIRLVAVGQ